MTSATLESPREGLRGRLENRFRDVMLIPAVQILNMQVEFAFLHKRLHEFFNQFRLQIADSRDAEFRLVHQIGPSGQIHHD